MALISVVADAAAVALLAGGTAIVVVANCLIAAATRTRRATRSSIQHRLGPASAAPVAKGGRRGAYRFSGGSALGGRGRLTGEGLRVVFTDMALQACGCRNERDQRASRWRRSNSARSQMGVPVVADHSDLVVHDFPRLLWGEIVVPGVLNAARDLAAALGFSAVRLGLPGTRAEAVLGADVVGGRQREVCAVPKRRVVAQVVVVVGGQDVERDPREEFRSVGAESAKRDRTSEARAT